VRLLIVRDGFDPMRLAAAGYAEYHPMASNGNVEGRATNRRVDIVILGQTLPLASTPVLIGPQVLPELPGAKEKPRP